MPEGTRLTRRFERDSGRVVEELQQRRCEDGPTEAARSERPGTSF